MALVTYADLTTQIATWLARGDLTLNIPDFITLFEAEANGKLGSRLQIVTTTLVADPITGIVALPSDFSEVDRVTWQGDPSIELDYEGPENLSFNYPFISDESTPNAYTIEGSNLKIGPVDATSTPITFVYKQTIGPLATSTNWLWKNYPNAYLFGSLCEAQGFNIDSDKMAMWMSRRDSVFDDIAKKDFRARSGHDDTSARIHALMPILPIGGYRPDVSDYMGQTTQNVSNVFPRGDGYGPVPGLSAFSAPLPSACRGFFYARKNDGSIQVFAGTIDRLYTLNNSNQTWVPVSAVATLTSITNASPGVVNFTAHGFAANDPVVFGGTVLPGQLTAGTTYFVSATGLASNSFQVSTTPGGASINTSGGSGTPTCTSKYTGLVSTAQWQFRQFNNFVIAVQVNVAPQVYDMTSSAAFAALGGTPPQAAYISIVNRFVVLSGLAAPNVYRVQWSGLNATTTWDNVSLMSNFQDLPDGGIVRGCAGGEFGVIFQDTSIRSLTFAPGSAYIFDIERISADDGLLAPYSLINAADRIFFLSPQGFKMLVPGGYPTPIGKERVDRTFFADFDINNPQLLIGASDPRSTRVFWAYKSVAGSAGVFDKIIYYDWALDEWSPITGIMGEYVSSLATPGLTLEGVDTAYSNMQPVVTITIASPGVVTLAAHGFTAGQQVTFDTTGALPTGLSVATPYFVVSPTTNTFEVAASLGGSAITTTGSQSGTHWLPNIETLSIKSLDNISIAAFSQPAAFDTSNRLSFFGGPNLEATLVTSEQGGDGTRFRVNGFRPITDAPVVFGSTLSRETVQATPALSGEQLVNGIGMCPQRVSTRFARAKMRIPVGTAWTFCAGVEPDIKPEGLR